jgi:competence protein ComEA
MLEFLTQKKKIIIIVLAIIILGGYYIYNSSKDYNTIEETQEILVASNTTETKEDEEEDMIAIHITGAVKTPGVVKVKEGSRIEDVIEVAGGLTEDADITNVNLAYIVDDGIKIRIPSINDETETEDDYITEDSGEGVVVSGTTESSKSSSLVNINTATQTELETLNGIGPSLASKIIEYRETNGKFKTIEDIKNVTGIGDKKYESIKDFIKV